MDLCTTAEGCSDIMNDESAATQLLHQLSCLRLGIIQAASYLNDNNITLAADYLSLMACVSPREIPQSLLQMEASRLNHQNALGLLKTYLFVVSSQADGFITLRRLVPLATRNWLRSSGLLEPCTLRVGRRMNEAFPSNDPVHRRLWREYLPHAQLLLQCKEFPHDEQAWDPDDLSYKVAECLFSAGRYPGAEDLFWELLNKRQRQLVAIDRDMLHLMARLATTYSRCGPPGHATQLSQPVSGKLPAGSAVGARTGSPGYAEQPDQPRIHVAGARTASRCREDGAAGRRKAEGGFRTGPSGRVLQLGDSGGGLPRTRAIGGGGSPAATGGPGQYSPRDAAEPTQSRWRSSDDDEKRREATAGPAHIDTVDVKELLGGWESRESKRSFSGVGGRGGRSGLGTPKAKAEVEMGNNRLAWIR